MTQHNPSQFFCEYCLLNGAKIQADYIRENYQNEFQALCEFHTQQADRIIETDIERR